MRQGGSGLGLSIVATVAEAHGGDAHAADRPQGGADVWLAIPVAPESGGRPRAAVRA